MTEDRPEGQAALAGVARQLIGEFAAVGARLRSYAEVDEVLADLARVCLPASSAAAETAATSSTATATSGDVTGCGSRT